MIRPILLLLLTAGSFSGTACSQPLAPAGNEKLISMDTLVLQDKIKGGWAGQTIGVTFGGPTEFKFNGTFIQDYQPIIWYDGYLKKTMTEQPGLYDDIYMDLTFVDVMERCGIDAPVDSFAQAFAHADYPLWHANQAARNNILNGLRPPASGHWLNNPHADDIDYQIEADFSGLMCPGMPNAASAISDRIGHIMNYGDGWYGGVFVGAMYAQAFVSDDIEMVVEEALKTIPAQSAFHQCMQDVISWHKQNPDDWKQTWFEIQRKWSEDKGCPAGVFAAFNIDARLNAAYVLLGLLYGKGDFGRTLEIATRAGQDSDCNPSTAGGILGTLLGYSQIPASWKQGLHEVEDMNFKYTSMSLNQVYTVSYKHALEMIRRNGGALAAGQVRIVTQEPVPVRLEKSFEGIRPSGRYPVTKLSDSAYGFEFEGTGFVVRGRVAKKHPQLPDRILEAILLVDEQPVDTCRYPTDFNSRKLELAFKYQLPDQKHRVRIHCPDLPEGYQFIATDYTVYIDEKPAP